VRRDHRPPAPAQTARDEAAGVRQRHPRDPAGAQQRRHPLQRLGRARQVLDDVAHDDRVVVAQRQIGLEQVAGAHVESEAGAGELRRELRGLDAGRQPAALDRLGQQKADPAAEVQQRAVARAAVVLGDRHRRQARLDAIQRAARGLALAGLLLDVVVGGGAGVGALEHGVVGHRFGLAVAAARAAHEIGEGGAEAVGRRDQPVRSRVAGHLQMRDEAGGPACAAARHLASLTIG
jgi:hypothetical protein